MQFAIDPTAGTPIYLQLKDQIRYAMAVGDLGPGDALPSIRALEAALGLNRNTVRRAYLELRDEGSLVVRRGAEVRVAAGGATARPRVREPRVRELVRRLVRDVEAKGFDGLRVAAALAEAAAAHDAQHPKYAFVECSQNQADDLAAAAQTALRRRVVGIDIELLRSGRGALLPSTRLVLTTHWHAAEVKKLAVGAGRTVRAVRLEPSPQFLEGVRRLQGLKAGIIVRDRESIAGYRALVRRYVKVKGPIGAAVMAEPGATRALMDAVAGLVFTAPCREFVHACAPPRLILEELRLDPATRDLAQIEGDFFP